MPFLDKFCSIWIAVIIAAGISLALMVVLKGLVDNEIKKFESLELKETKKIPLERN
jgi:ACR3 family arsenite efflux pump ArsB